jgi:hypothetical protein
MGSYIPTVHAVRLHLHWVSATAACVVSSSTARAQSCLGLPDRFAVSATYLRYSGNASETVSLGASATPIRSAWTSYAAGVELGRIDAHVALLSHTGYVGTALVTASREANAWHPCLSVARTFGEAPAASAGTGASLAGTALQIGGAHVITDSTALLPISLHTTWQCRLQDAGGSDHAVRAGLQLLPLSRAIVRIGYVERLTAPSAGAVTFSVGARW